MTQTQIDSIFRKMHETLAQEISRVAVKREEEEGEEEENKFSIIIFLKKEIPPQWLNNLTISLVIHSGKRLESKVCSIECRGNWGILHVAVEAEAGQIVGTIATNIREVILECQGKEIVCNNAYYDPQTH